MLTLGGGTLLAIAPASGATNAFMEFMKLPTAHEAMMAQGCFLAPHAGVNTAIYADGTLRGQGDIFQL